MPSLSFHPVHISATSSVARIASGTSRNLRAISSPERRNISATPWWLDFASAYARPWPMQDR